MNIRQSLNMKLSQNLVMTQSLQQAIKLLQLSKLEMESLIRTELESNPVLEEVIDESAPSTDERIQQQDEGRTSEIEVNGSDSNMDEIDSDYFYEDYIDYQHSRGMSEVAEIPNFENMMSTATTLVDHLEWQLSLVLFSDQETEYGQTIIGNLNKDGYLQATIEEIAELTGGDPEDIEFVRQEIMRFDPVGVAALDLREALLVQLEALKSDDAQLPMQIISNFLPYLEKHAYEELAKELKVPLSEIQRSLTIIRSLDPKPGRKYSGGESTFVEPDVFILKDDDDYSIILNEENLPQLQINKDYQQMIARNAEYKEETKTYIREHVNNAKWLLKSFLQRQRTIYKVVQSIVERQREFFDKGTGFLKPMVLSDVAEDIGMHESTVSRVVTNKYAHTPRGVFELKYFFSTGIRSSSGEDISSIAVKRRIKQIVDEENAKKPLSDSKIMAMLNEEGLKIARRTVAKYREELNIPPSKQRKSIF
jgi:RNA polymerase sigma-54 factor